MSKCYIAGPMTGIPEFNRPAFFKAAEDMAKSGYTVLNPAILPDGLEQHHYMDICLAMVRCCTAIVALHGWEQSDGAKVEVALGRKLGMAIWYQ